MARGRARRSPGMAAAATAPTGAAAASASGSCSSAGAAPAIALPPAVAALQDEMVAWRRKLHAAPELSFEERETAAFVAATLRSFGIAEVVEGVGRTGVVALIRGGAGDGECIALRADMDALPLQVSARARRHAPISTPTPETPTMSTSLAAMRACAVWPITYSWREYRSSSTAGNPRASEQALHASERATRRRRADARVRVLARGSDFLLTARGTDADACHEQCVAVAMNSAPTAVPHRPVLASQETSGAPYASKVAGVMHACGHDGHIAALLGVARILAQVPPPPPATRCLIAYVPQLLIHLAHAG